ncbi:MAG: hypothetical protein QM728_00070 [Gordonia sp. (in: high G+C Gram-positive bacteria)]|uniref:hypothetical protein n=1 Tax=Gordonia sp. (in: high G+C Gram-positive bacteria) TaxID=84139 RepID=UPI0039E6BC0A
MSDDVHRFPGDPDEWRSVDENVGTVDGKMGTVDENVGTLDDHRRGHPRWLITGTVVATFLAIALLAGTLVVGKLRGGTTTTPGATVTSYLQALAAGDAQRALSLGAHPPESTRFLTDDILKKQIAKTPISDIEVLRESTAQASRATVRMSARFGDTTSEFSVLTVKSGKGWKMMRTAIRIRGFDGAKTGRLLTLFGQPISGDISVFPGYAQFAGTGPNLTVSSSNAFVKPDWLMLGMAFPSQLRLKVVPTAAGADAAEKAIKAAFAQCLSSTDLRPPRCPNRVYSLGAVPGSAKWGEPSELKFGRTLFLWRTTTLVYSLGSMTFPVTYTAADGPTSETVRRYVTARVDLLSNPPTVTF